VEGAESVGANVVRALSLLLSQVGRKDVLEQKRNDIIRTFLSNLLFSDHFRQVVASNTTMYNEMRKS
jgi:hypothetical protein